LHEKLKAVTKMIGGVDVERGSELFGESVKGDSSARERRLFAEMDKGTDWDCSGNQAASENGDFF
jgi:hypothetical protein